MYCARRLTQTRKMAEPLIISATCSRRRIEIKRHLLPGAMRSDSTLQTQSRNETSPAHCGSLRKIKKKQALNINALSLTLLTTLGCTLSLTSCYPKWVQPTGV